MLIDSHQHFWRYNAAEFGWIPDEMSSIRRDFMPGDLRVEVGPNGLDGVVSVQARQSEEETSWLFELAAAADGFIRGVVGWVPLVESDVPERLARYVESPKFVGVRHVLQAEPDAFMAGAEFNRGLRTLADFDLAYDVLILERQLPEAISLVDRHPRLRFVLDHLGKPRNDVGEIEPWRSNIRELAKRPNVWCKVSGGMTESQLDWTAATVRPYLDAVLDAFGPARLTYGSNWPVAEAAGGYRKWLDAIAEWAAPLADDERQWIFARAACEVYGLEVSR